MGPAGLDVYRFELRSPLLREPLDWTISIPSLVSSGSGVLSRLLHSIFRITSGVSQVPRGRNAAFERTRSSMKSCSTNSEATWEQNTQRSGYSYLADLGINCIEVTPITNVGANLNWGFEPIGFLGVDERFGNRINFQRFVSISRTRPGSQ